MPINHNDIIVYDFEWFHSFYNTKTGKLVNIKNENLSFQSEIFEINDFFTKDIVIQTEAPTFICLNLTSECNLRCKYCFNLEHKKAKCTFDEIIKFIDKVIEWKPNSPKFFVDMAGSGEPLLEIKLILKIAKYCKKKSDDIKKEITPMLATNGVLLTKGMVDILQRNSVLFGISLDGYKSLHDTYRVDCNGKGTYDKIIFNIKAIKDATYVGGAMTISNSNTDIFQAYQTMLKLFGTVSIKPGRINYDDFDFTFIIQGYEKTIEWLIKEALDYKFENLLKIINGDDFLGKTILKVMSNSILERRCDAGINKFALGWDGNIYPCSPAILLKEFIIHSSLGLPSILNNFQICNVCECRNICGSLCYIQKFQFGHSQNLCNFKKEIFKLSIYFCGSIELSNLKIYESIIFEAQKIVLRSTKDNDLESLAKNDACGMSYTKLKHLKDTHQKKYKKIKQKYLG